MNKALNNNVITMFAVQKFLLLYHPSLRTLSFEVFLQENDDHAHYLILSSTHRMIDNKVKAKFLLFCSVRSVTDSIFCFFKKLKSDLDTVDNITHEYRKININKFVNRTYLPLLWTFGFYYTANSLQRIRGARPAAGFHMTMRIKIAV